MLHPAKTTRRRFIKQATASGMALAVPYFIPSRVLAAEGDKLALGAIGVGGQGTYIAKRATAFANLVAVADVDLNHARRANEGLAGGRAHIFQDYREVLDRKDVQVVTIGTPDHWHTKIAIEAMQAGKDVYCEKPLTLTIDEGKKICQVAKETGRVFQVGTQQRSEDANRFLTAVALAHHGRLGQLKRALVAIGGGPQGGPFKKTEPPQEFDWNTWLGQAPAADYIRERSHGNFRWWYEYSGGKMTDWGAHHVDIAQWAIGMDESGPGTIEEISPAVHPVPLKDGYPTADDQYNTAQHFQVRCQFAGDLEIVIADVINENPQTRFGNGLLLEGDNGRIFVNRGRLSGKPVDELRENPLPEGWIEKLRKGKKPGSHMGNFFECVRDRSMPVSDVFTHHRALSTCHLANICIRLGRKLNWDPEAQQIVGDEDANSWVSREQRKGYEIVV